MRATTCWMPKVSRATRAAMMLELSPLETAAKASALSMSARSRTPWSNPIPVTLVPLNEGPSRRNASGLLSMTETVWLRSSRLRARVEPTRPHPMITTCTGETLHGRRGASLATRGCRRRLQTDPPGPQAAEHAARRDVAVQADRAAGLRERRPLFGGLRPRGGLHHVVGRRGLGVRLLLEDRHLRRRRDADGGRVVPAERARLSQRRRRLRGRDRQPRQ